MKKYLLILSMVMIACGSVDEIITDGELTEDSDTDVAQDVIVIDVIEDAVEDASPDAVEDTKSDVIIDAGSDVKDAGKNYDAHVCDKHHYHH